VESYTGESTESIESPILRWGSTDSELDAFPWTLSPVYSLSLPHAVVRPTCLRRPLHLSRRRPLSQRPLRRHLRCRHRSMCHRRRNSRPRLVSLLFL